MNAHLKFKKPLAGFLVLSILHLCWMSSSAWAEMVATDAVVPSQTEIENPRQRLLNLMNRNEIRQVFENHRISKVEAVARVNSLMDDEVAVIVGRLDHLPEGGHNNIPPQAFVLGLMLFWVGVAGSISIMTCSVRGAVCSVGHCQKAYRSWRECAGTWFHGLTGKGFPVRAPVKNRDTGAHSDQDSGETEKD